MTWWGFFQVCIIAFFDFLTLACQLNFLPSSGFPQTSPPASLVLKFLVNLLTGDLLTPLQVSCPAGYSSC